MNTTLADAHILADGVRNQAEHCEHIEIVLCPPAVWLTELAHSIAPGKLPYLHLGAQNMYFEEIGTFTGEISPLMVKEVAEYVILGHSERTHIFNEGPDLIKKKLASAFKHGLKPILCVGEDVREDGSKERLARELQYLVNELSPEDMKTLVVAYEPVWAISHGAAVPATPDYAQDVVAALRQVVASETRVLYGGSINSENVGGFLAQPDIDGYLIGGASLKLKDFLGVCIQANDLSIPKISA